MNRREIFSCLWWSAAAARGASQERAKSGDPDTVYMLTYDHGGLVLWGIDHFTKYLHSAIEWMDRYPGFKMGLENEAYTYDYMAENEPKLLEEVRGYLARYRGRFGIGTCTYGQPLSQFINEESNVRQIEYALEADRKHFGTAPPVYIMSEHGMHSQIPQLVAGFGFQGAIMRTHFMMYGYNPEFDAAIGWWVGMDGSRISTVPTYKGEGAEFGRTTVDNWILTRYPSAQAKESPEDFRQKFGRLKPLLLSRADDAGLRREELVKMYEGKPGFRWILLEELLALFPRPQAELKTGPNDYQTRMPWGYCGNEIWNQSRQAEVSVLTAERLAALEVLLGGTDREADLRQSWKNLLVGQHHDIQITGILKDARRFLGGSLATSGRVGEESLKWIAAGMRGGGAGQVTVFNPHSWARKEWVEAEVRLPAGFAGTLAASHGGKRVPCVVISSEKRPDGSIDKARVAIQAEVAGLGLASYALEPAREAQGSVQGGVEADPSKLLLRNAYWDLTLHPEGGIASLVDRKTGKAFLKSGARAGFFSGKIDGKDCESQGKWSLGPGPEGARWVTAREQGSIGGIPYTLELTMRAESSRLDCRATFHIQDQKIGMLSENKRDGKSAFLHEEKLRWKLFPACGEGAKAARDVPFGVAETSQRYVEGNYWTAISDGTTGVAVLNRGTMGSVREADGSFSVPLAHAMYYVWRTVMLNGDYSYEFALYPFSGEWVKADLHRRALEYNFPFRAAGTAAGDGRFGEALQLVSVDSQGALVTALYTAGGKLHVRMWEQHGRPGKATLSYRRGGARLTEIDLAGKAIRATGASLAFRPWQIRTIRVEPKGR